MATCNQDSYAPNRVLLSLPENQGGPGRHLCCNCAYQQGISDAQDGWEPTVNEIVECQHGRMARLAIIESLHQNQGGPQRHKCVVCAYAIGYGEDLILEPSEDVALDNETLTIIEIPEVGEKRKRTGTFTPRKYAFAPGTDRASEIGLAGEEFVFSKELLKLADFEDKSLVERAIHVSKKLGDGAGYDILSYSEEGKEIYIEVKTTLGPDKTAFYITKNEMDFAEKYKDQFLLYRVCNFDMERSAGNLFILTFDELIKLNMTPTNFVCEF